MSQETNTTSAVREAGQNKIKSLVEEFGSTLQEVWDACPFVNDLFSAAFVSIHQIKERAKTDAAAVLKNPAHEPAYRECVEQWLLAVSYFANRYVAVAAMTRKQESAKNFESLLVLIQETREMIQRYRDEIEELRKSNAELSKSEKALQAVLFEIASLWPAGTSCRISDVGINEVRSHALLLEAAIDTARVVLKLPLTPK